MTHNQVTQNLQKNRQEISTLQNQTASQKRINKPSDDPAAAARVLTSKTEERSSAQFIKNINMARSFLEYTDQSLSELSEALMRAKELAIQQANDAGASSETRRLAALEVEQIYNQSIQIGNRKLGERFIFSGYKTTTQPFDAKGDYHGDDGDMKLQINKNAFMAMNVAGSKVLLGQGLGEDGLVKSSPIVPKDVGEVIKLQDAENLRIQKNEEMLREPVALRAPGSEKRDSSTTESKDVSDQAGANVLHVLKNLEMALRVNDKTEVQAAVDNLDSSISQVVNSRAAIGSRVSAINAAQDSLQKAIVDNKLNASQLEDADLFQTVSDMSKADTTLKATLETSGKVMNTSLLDFLK